MKAYYAGPGPCSGEYGYVDLIFANNWKEARKLAWSHGDSQEACDGEYKSLTVERRKEHDALFAKTGREDAHVCRDRSITRLAGWQCEYDDRCAACWLATMEDEFPVCPECERCSECGHADDCKTRSRDNNGLTEADLIGGDA